MCLVTKMVKILVLFNLHALLKNTADGRVCLRSLRPLKFGRGPSLCSGPDPSLCSGPGV